MAQNLAMRECDVALAKLRRKRDDLQRRCLVLLLQVRSTQWFTMNLVFLCICREVDLITRWISGHVGSSVMFQSGYEACSRMKRNPTLRYIRLWPSWDCGKSPGVSYKRPNTEKVYNIHTRNQPVNQRLSESILNYVISEIRDFCIFLDSHLTADPLN